MQILELDNNLLKDLEQGIVRLEKEVHLQIYDTALRKSTKGEALQESEDSIVFQEAEEEVVPKEDAALEEPRDEAKLKEQRETEALLEAQLFVKFTSYLKGVHNLKVTGLKTPGHVLALANVLKSKFSPITHLSIEYSQIEGEWVQDLANSLTNLTSLRLVGIKMVEDNGYKIL